MCWLRRWCRDWLKIYFWIYCWSITLSLNGNTWINLFGSIVCVKSQHFKNGVMCKVHHQPVRCSFVKQNQIISIENQCLLQYAVKFQFNNKILTHFRRRERTAIVIRDPTILFRILLPRGKSFNGKRCVQWVTFQTDSQTKEFFLFTKATGHRNRWNNIFVVRFSLNGRNERKWFVIELISQNCSARLKYKKREMNITKLIDLCHSKWTIFISLTFHI